MAKKLKWIKIANKLEDVKFQKNNICIIEVADKKISIATYHKQIFACAHKCPHAGAIMANGFIDATGNIVCALHKYKFKLNKGRNISGEGYYLKTYTIEHKPDGIYIGFEENNLLNS